jgi:lysozyme
MTINKATLDLMKEFEGLRLEAYPDPGTGGEPITIGYGTTARAGVGITPKLGMRITKAEAEEYFRRTLVKFADEIRPAIKRPINENQFGAFMSLAYNIGPGAFKRSSALRKFNAGDIAGAADAILLFNKAGGKVMRGLQRRREAERALFLSPPSSLGPRPSEALRAEGKDPATLAPAGWFLAVSALAAAAWQWGEDALAWLQSLF